MLINQELIFLWICLPQVGPTPWLPAGRGWYSLCAGNVSPEQWAQVKFKNLYKKSLYNKAMTISSVVDLWYLYRFSDPALDPGSWCATLTKKKPVLRIRYDLELNSKSDHDQDDLKMSDQQSIITASQHPSTKHVFLPVRANVAGPRQRSWPRRRAGGRRSGQSWPGRRRSAGSPPAPWPGEAPLRYSLTESAKR